MHYNVRISNVYKQETVRVLDGKEKKIYENTVVAEAVIYLPDPLVRGKSVLISPWSCKYVSRKELKVDDDTKFELWLKEVKERIHRGARIK